MNPLELALTIRSGSCHYHGSEPLKLRPRSRDGVRTVGSCGGRGKITDLCFDVGTGLSFASEKYTLMFFPICLVQGEWFILFFFLLSFLSLSLFF